MKATDRTAVLLLLGLIHESDAAARAGRERFALVQLGADGKPTNALICVTVPSAVAAASAAGLAEDGFAIIPAREM